MPRQNVKCVSERVINELQIAGIVVQTLLLLSNSELVVSKLGPLGRYSQDECVERALTSKEKINSCNSLFSKSMCPRGDLNPHPREGTNTSS